LAKATRQKPEKTIAKRRHVELMASRRVIAVAIRRVGAAPRLTITGGKPACVGGVCASSGVEGMLPSASHYQSPGHSRRALRGHSTPTIKWWCAAPSIAVEVNERWPTLEAQFEL